MTLDQRAKDHWKRGIFLFKLIFDLSRYDFRFSRYRRVKKRVIFLNHLPSITLSLISLTSYLIELSQTPDKSDRHNS